VGDPDIGSFGIGGHSVKKAFPVRNEIPVAEYY
jgi:hypothetical protein